MRFVLFLLLAWMTVASPYDELERQAERFYDEKSFSRARELYEQGAPLAPAEKQRWVAFRLADTGWRSSEPLHEEARKALEALIRDTGEERDRVWAEANESLGDMRWMHGRNQGAALPFYLAALDWWAGSDELSLARSRYLSIVFRMGRPEGEHYDQFYWARSIPRQVLINAVAIAESPEDRVQARFLLATHLLLGGNPADVERGLELLDDVIREGRGTPYYDDALFAAAQRHAQGVAVVLDDGRTELRPDNRRALELYRRITTEFRRGESRYYDNAIAQIENLVNPSLTLGVAGTFLPQSEQEFILTSRNIRDAELTITAVDLLRDLDWDGSGAWQQRIRSGGRSPIRRWTVTTKDGGDHALLTEKIRIAPKLDRGAYILRAAGAGETAEQLLLVTDANVLAHTASGRSEIFVTDAITGQPVAGARVRLWHFSGPSASAVSSSAQTGANGLVSMATKETHGQMLVVAAAPNGAQAYLQSWSGYRPARHAEWRIYAFTDRPAYRPDETVHWKFIARVREADRWTTPAGELHYEIVGPRGEKVVDGRAKLNEFGAFWSDLPLTASMPLGTYTIRFRRTDAKHEQEYAGHAQLFRLEEYKLPEFEVRIVTPEKPLRLGDTAEVSIEASYYFGGPVANATVQAVVYRQPFFRYWPMSRAYPWYWQRPDRGQGQQISEETLRTDASGRATLRIATPRDGQDSIYRIEARVTDASRREVTGTGTIRVTRQRYSVMAHPQRYLIRPGDRVSVDFKALDANDQPMQTTGTVRVMRRRWREKAYRDEEVLKTTVTTDERGEATLTFDAPREGYYSIEWVSEDRDPARPARVRDLVRAQTAVWVSDTRSTDLGYRAGGLEIIVDRDSFRAGETAAAMIVTPASGRWVMFTASAGSILDTQILRLDGTVKLVQFEIDERHVPSFNLTASTVFDRMLSTAMKHVVVPPVEHFIDVDVKMDRDEYEPRNEGTIVVTTRDVDGKPLSAEVALSVADEAVTAISADPAGDPRQFFFGEQRPYSLHVAASVQTQRYLLLVESERGELIDEREREQARGAGKMAADSAASFGGVAAGVPPPAAPQAAVAEAITVTGERDAMRRERQQGPGQTMEVVVRSDFRSTAFWQPDIRTGPDGTARVTVTFPEALTTWRATARAVTTATEVGIGSTTARTSLPLLVRLQAPRFFVAGDRATVSAVMNNNSDEAMEVVASLEIEGGSLRHAGDGTGAPTVSVPARGEARVDWRVVAEGAGAVKLRVAARGTGGSDAMERAFTVFEHGIDKLVARSGKLRADDAIIRLDLPRERRATDLTVRIQPSLASTMLDALPYLIDFPYGCTEQTMSRFLPAAIVSRTLETLGIDARIPDLDRVTAAGIARLRDMQHAGGGWGWWKEGNSDDFMTAYVVWGFAVAKEGGVAVDAKMVERAIRYLDLRLIEHENNRHLQTWMLHAMAAWQKAAGGSAKTANQVIAFNNVWAARERLNAYSRALLALAAHDMGDRERALVLIRNLRDGVDLDRSPDRSILIPGSGSGAAETMATAHWGEDGFWWRWYEGPVESTAFALRALVRIDPANQLVEPAMNWLVKNRRGAQWNNTRDTAIAILALNDYLVASGEIGDELGFELSVNGRVVETKRLAKSEMLSGAATIRVDEALVREANEIRIRRTAGKAPIYFAIEGRFVSLEEPVTAAGNEIFVRREYFRLAPKPTLLKGVTYDRLPLTDNGTVQSGERVEVVVTIETKNDYSYLMFEDLKPAGLEAVELQSGGSLHAAEVNGRRTVSVYRELRDRKVALFIDQLPQGLWTIRYSLRAEVPGYFHALPLLGEAMYVPEIRANGDEVRITVAESASASGSASGGSSP